jgi:hypothetical protein
MDTVLLIKRFQRHGLRIKKERIVCDDNSVFVARWKRLTLRPQRMAGGWAVSLTDGKRHRPFSFSFSCVSSSSCFEAHH